MTATRDQPTPSRTVDSSPTHETNYSNTPSVRLSAEMLRAQQEREAAAPRQSVIQSLQGAIQSLARAYQQGIETNPMCADVAVFQKMTAMQKELGAMMLEVNKMRGL